MSAGKLFVFLIAGAIVMTVVMQWNNNNNPLSPLPVPVAQSPAPVANGQQKAIEPSRLIAKSPAQPASDHPGPQDATASHDIGGPAGNPGASQIQNPAPASIGVQPNPAPTPAATFSQLDGKDFRYWTDATGEHTVKAKLVTAKGNKLKLLKQDGVAIELSVDRLSKEDRKWVIDDQLKQTRMEHVTWTIKIAEKQLAAEWHSTFVGGFGVGPNSQNYQTTYVHTRLGYAQVCAELVSYKGLDVTLRELCLTPQGDAPAIRQYGMSKTFRYGALGEDDRKFLDRYRRLEREYERSAAASQESADDSEPQPPTAQEAAP